jgi:formate-dependent nitrite reductase cytochrome c552 subunit
MTTLQIQPEQIADFAPQYLEVLRTKVIRRVRDTRGHVIRMATQYGRRQNIEIKDVLTSSNASEMVRLASVSMYFRTELPH